MGGAKSLLTHSRFIRMLMASHDTSNEPKKGRRDNSDRDKASQLSLKGKDMLSPRNNDDDDSANIPVHLTIAWLVKWIRLVFEEKTTADAQARDQDAPILPLPDFLLELQRLRFGLPHVVYKKTLQVLHAIDVWRDRSVEVEFFAQCLEESRPLDELVLFLRIRSLVCSCSTGTYYQGHIGSKAPTCSGVAEYLGLDRAYSVIATVFASSLETQQELKQQIAQRGQPWSTLSPGVPRGDLPAESGVPDNPSDFCLLLYIFVDLLLCKFRDMELRFRHDALSERLFASQDPMKTGTLDFEGFKTIFLAARPRYTPREIALLFANLTRQSRVGNFLTLPAFKRLVHQLMASGVVFHHVVGSDQTSQAVHMSRQVVAQHYSNFKAFLDSFTTYLDGSRDRVDLDCVDALSRLRTQIEAEIIAPGTSASTADAVAQGGLRLSVLYRALLHVVLNHQSSWLLSHIFTQAKPLHIELRALEHVVYFRHRLFTDPQAEADGWLARLDPSMFINSTVNNNTLNLTVNIGGSNDMVNHQSAASLTQLHATMNQGYGGETPSRLGTSLVEVDAESTAQTRGRDSITTTNQMKRRSHGSITAVTTPTAASLTQRPSGSFASSTRPDVSNTQASTPGWIRPPSATSLSGTTEAMTTSDGGRPSRISNAGISTVMGSTRSVPSRPSLSHAGASVVGMNGGTSSGGPFTPSAISGTPIPSFPSSLGSQLNTRHNNAGAYGRPLGEDAHMPFDMTKAPIIPKPMNIDKGSDRSTVSQPDSLTDYIQTFESSFVPELNRHAAHMLRARGGALSST